MKEILLNGVYTATDLTARDMHENNDFRGLKIMIIDPKVL